MKKIKANISGLSTTAMSPTLSPSMSSHFSQMSPTVLKEKLRGKTKQQPGPFIKIKYHLKERYNHSFNYQPARQQVNWVIYNMLVGIYTNWLRLAPYIIHLLAATKRDKIEDIQKLIQRVTKDKQRIESLKNRQQYIKNINKAIIKSQSSHEQLYDDNLLEQIQLSCAQVKCSTQLFNGYILGQKRGLKTEKQNLLANKLMSQISKDDTLSRSKMIFVNQNVSRVVDTIVDRLQVVKYLREKKIKINDKIMEPLRKVFNSSKYLYQDQQINTAKIIQKIKSKFKKFKSFNVSSQMTEDDKKIVRMSSTKDQNSAYNEEKCEIKLQDQQMIDEQIEQKLGYDENQKNLQNRRDKSKKKIGFIINEEDYEKFLEQQVNIDKIPKNIYELYRQRKVVLNRQVNKNKMKGMINELKKTQNQKKNESDDQIKDKNFQKLQKQKNKNANNKVKQKNKANQKNNKQILANESYKQKSVNFINLSNRESKDDIQESDDSESTSNQGSTSTHIRKYERHKSKKYLKSGKLLKKRNLKRPSLLFDKIDLQNFDQELRAEQNIINKKKKIINLFNRMQSEGIIKTKSLKKLVSYARNIQQEFRKGPKNKDLRKCNFSQDVSAPASFYLIPLPQQQNRKSDFQIPLSRPFKFLTTFNRQAVENWIPNNYNRHNDEFFSHQLQKCRFSGIDHDMNIPTLEKEEFRPQKRWFNKQSMALQLGQKLIKNLSNNKIGQKSINIEKQKLFI